MSRPTPNDEGMNQCPYDLTAEARSRMQHGGFYTNSIAKIPYQFRGGSACATVAASQKEDSIAPPL